MPSLVFVYGVDGGIVHGIVDYFHKLISPETYSCNLCALTHGSLGQRPAWSQFVSKLKIPTKFLHRDEFSRQYADSTPLPAIFLESTSGLELLIAKHEIEGCGHVDDLISVLGDKIKHLEGAP